MKRVILGLLTATVLASCGSERASIGAVTAESLLGYLRPQEEATDIRSALSRSALDQVAIPVLLVEVPDTDSEAIAQVFGQNGDVVTWSTANDVTFAFRQGVLVATRGLGNDLMSADVAEPLRAIRGDAPSQSAVRVHRYLDGQRQVVTRSFVCSYRNLGRYQVEIIGMVVDTTRITETCVTSDGQFENRYEIGMDGTMWRSRQWVHPEIGYVLTERLKK